jgi:hypothetical protein
MKKWKKILLILIALGAILGTIIFYVATKKPPTSEDSKPVAVFKSVELISKLESDSTVSKEYMFKNIAVEGTIKEIKEQDHSVIIDAGESSFINCSFDSTAFAKCRSNFSLGKAVSIKGIYYAFDKTADDGMGLIPVEKNAFLRTCFINN